MLAVCFTLSGITKDGAKGGGGLCLYASDYDTSCTDLKKLNLLQLNARKYISSHRYLEMTHTQNTTALPPLLRIVYLQSMAHLD